MSIVVASARAYESLLGIDIRRVPQISGGRRRRHRMAAIEAPGMIARILLIGKLSSAALPFQSYFVFGHAFYMECGQALRQLALTASCSVQNQRSPLLKLISVLS